MPFNQTTGDAAERIDRISPSKASFTTGGGVASVEYVLRRGQMGAFIRDILGAAAFTAQGNLNRYLPAAHPQFDYLYATRISNIEGITPEGRIEAAPLQRILQNHFRDVAIYSQYRMVVEFEPRPYLIETDDSLKATWEVNKKYYYDFQNAANFSQFTDCKEYNRFVEISMETNAEFLTTPTNVFQYRHGWPDGNPVGATSGAGVNVLICKPTVKMTWYFVPYEMVFCKNITEALGRVNQYDFIKFKAGTLLFKGIEVNKYAPPYQIIGQAANVGARPEHTRMCDITYIFEYFSQNNDDLGQGIPGGLGQAIPAFGHNLTIHGSDYKYYYVSARPNPLNPKQDYRPIYLSYPMEKLFRYDV